MKDRYVVDTNVLIAASAAHPTNPKDIDATPEDPVQRILVWEWLCKFEESPSAMILDCEGGIVKEYENKLGFNDYGIQVLQYKWSTAEVDNVHVDYDSEGHGVLYPPLLEIIHDQADKKMVAAALAAYEEFGDSCVAFAGDTDWHDWEEHLLANNIDLEPIIEIWSRKKHADKKKR